MKHPQTKHTLRDCTNTTWLFIGFKGAGKSTVGQRIAQILQRPFIDLDQQIETEYTKQYAYWLPYRQILLKHGKAFFEHLEHQALKKAMACQGQVLATGGSTLLTTVNQTLIQSDLNPCRVIYLKAHKDRVFKRIMANGQPAFFPPYQDPYQSFTHLWAARLPIYESLANVTIENNGTVEETVEKLLQVDSGCKNR